MNKKNVLEVFKKSIVIPLLTVGAFLYSCTNSKKEGVPISKEVMEKMEAHEWGSVTGDTLKLSDSIGYPYGVTFFGKMESPNQDKVISAIGQPYEFFLRQKNIDQSFLSLGFQHGNFTTFVFGNDTIMATAKHVTQALPPFEENLEHMNYDVAIKVISMQRILHEVRDSLPVISHPQNLEGRNVVIKGFRFYKDHTEAIHWKMYGQAHKLSDEFIGEISKDPKIKNESSLDQTYYILVPPSIGYKKGQDLQGLSGSGVYISGTRDTLVGIFNMHIFDPERADAPVKLFFNTFNTMTLKELVSEEK